MTSRLNPVISFQTDARQAMEFYQSVLGGELEIMTFAGLGVEGEAANLVAHANLTTDLGFTLMASDTPPGMEFTGGSQITIGLSGDDEEPLRRYFDALAEGGNVTMPLERQAWGDVFGQLTDRFGIGWLVNIAG